MQCSLIQVMLYEFELSHNAIETIKNICCVKTESESWSLYSKQMVEKTSLVLQEPLWLRQI